MVGVGPFRQLQLAENDRTGLFQPGDDSRIFAGTIIAINLHARCGWRILGPAQVLDGDRHAMKRPPHLTFCDFLVGRVRLLQCRRAHDMRVAFQLAIEACDAIQLGLRCLHSRQIAFLNALPNFDQFTVVQIARRHQRVASFRF